MRSPSPMSSSKGLPRRDNGLVSPRVEIGYATLPFPVNSAASTLPVRKGGRLQEGFLIFLAGSEFAPCFFEQRRIGQQIVRQA